MVTVQACSISYGYRRAGMVLDHVSFTAGPGVTGLLGVNGAGKTTLMKILATVLRPQRGELRWDGQVVGAAVRRQIGFMPQHQPAVRGFTVKEYVEYLAWLKGVPRKACPGRADQALQTVDLRHRADAAMGSLSGGMLRRGGSP